MFESNHGKPTIISSKVLREFSLFLFLIPTPFLIYQMLHGRYSVFLLILLLSFSLMGLIGIFYPETIRIIYYVVFSIVRPIGNFLSWILLLMIYYLIITPLAIFFRLCGRDVLRLKKSNVDTYWEKISCNLNKISYLRQYQKR